MARKSSAARAAEDTDLDVDYSERAGFLTGKAAAMGAKRALETQRRREQTVYTCRVCGSYWSPLGRLPTRPPTYCSQACRSREGYRRAKARGTR